MDKLDKFMKGAEKVFDDLGRVFDDMSKVFDDMPDTPKSSCNSQNHKYTWWTTRTTRTTTPASHTAAEPCIKCGRHAVTKKHVQVDTNRDCMLVSCSYCSFATTERTKDNPGRFDLPTVEEARKTKS